MNMKDLMREALKPVPAATSAPVFDAADPSLSGADDYTMADIGMAAAAAVQQWTETDDLDAGENYADRLMAMMVGVADQNKDGDITEDEQGVLDVALNAAWDYLSQCGASEDDISALLNDWDGDAAERVRDLVASCLPEGDDAASAAIDQFVFSAGDQEPALDAAYKKVFAVRHGKKTRISKRLSGSVRLSAKQKLAIRKARMKSHSAVAMMRRLKSIRVRRRMGL